MPNQNRHLTFGFSPCPNDTFIFDALYHQKIDTLGYNFDFVIKDVEELNKRALENEIDITKLSFATYAKCTDKYILCNSGSALGRGCGPLLISKSIHIDSLDPNQIIGIPGINTTANFLLSHAFPHMQHKKEMLFSEIEDALLSEEIDLGLIIHENRFTYQEKGLNLIKDLGQHWEQRTKMSIPLGGIVCSKRFSAETLRDIQKMIHDSLEFAIYHPDSSKDWIKSLSQEMESDVISNHIDLYVNEFSLNLGEEGRKSIEYLLQTTVDMKINEKISYPIFMN